MIIGVTGASGFLGWHLRCRIQARSDLSFISIDLRLNTAELALALAELDGVVHLAGVNSWAEGSAIEEENTKLAEELISALNTLDRPIPVVYANSIHSGDGTPFGTGKQNSARLLSNWAIETGSVFVNVYLPNLFGEHGRPNYNSFVATFASQLASGSIPEVIHDRSLELLHAQDAACILLEALGSLKSHEIKPRGHKCSVSQVLIQMSEIAQAYQEGHLPDLSDHFTRNLFNTYRSFTIPDAWPIYPIVHADARGRLVETVRAAGGEAQVFFSLTKPGYVRGQHFHLHKTERFLVLKGHALVRMRKLFSDEILTYEVSGDTPAILDMPTMWTHSIENIGQEDLLTLFYADDQFNPGDPDTYWIEV